jgi:hypothetical protein
MASRKALCTLIAMAAMGACATEDRATEGPGEASAPGGRIRCGQKLCPVSYSCCDGSCSVCRHPSSHSCEEICIKGRCERQTAEGVGACTDALGVRWNGATCEQLQGCECQGDDCDDVYPSLENCEAYNIDCR